MTLGIEAWDAWAQRLRTGDLVERADFRRAAADLTDEMAESLGQFYLKIGEQSIRALNRWLEDNDGLLPMPAQERRIRNLVLLFEHLAQYGHQPFRRTRVVRNSQLHPETPDWAKLPPAFLPLSQAAAKSARFQYVFSSTFRANALQIVGPAEIAIFSLAAKELERIGFREVNQWCSRMGVREHREASLMFNLLGVLDALFSQDEQ